ncbi:OmpA family protein [Agrobacterium vitis]|uniref:OmpA family protein n=1 Tax=Agrobacterium vitis TaxID=373 RepID=UPI0008729097|nr:OmpA family protein [Agrobacterium vitis]MCE6074150.1 OmpA family protein [Agrobacterium vitis]MCM2451763.1 OmpA family protein [Agrobacterium vitis]MCM2468979.1 OmpA family protein [Agrobacterium vitis]MUO71352.1 OmpA family protein [Agrobacterium vitis]MUO85109.1 OmpA family protein [Agrobacterium vitis]
MKDIFGQGRQEQESEWISISDLMSGLMLIFLFIAVVYLKPLVQEKNQAIEDKAKISEIQQSIRKIAVTWSESENEIYNALNSEFKDDLPRWNAELDKSSLTIRFKAPEVLFGTNSSVLKPGFKSILENFFPRYLLILDRYKESIDEVRIEGHTSSEWSTNNTPLEAYFKNMDLSQQRTRSVLEYALQLPTVTAFQAWAIRHVTANGLSSSRVIIAANGREDFDASRRVEFRVRTNAKEQIAKVVEELQ